MNGTKTQPDRSNICAVITAYYPDDGFVDRVRRTAAQVSETVIVNNTPSKDSPDAVKTASIEPGVQLIQNPQNAGLAKALNQGFQRAIAKGYQWILMMDQDSMPDPSMVQQEARAYEAFPNRDRVGLIGVNFTYGDTGHLAFAGECEGRQHIIKRGIQTSGSLLSIAAYSETGPFREDFFIDYVDTEYCLRLYRKGFLGIIACDAQMLHQIGNPTTVRLLSKEYETLNYNAMRRYYRTRNGLILAWEYALKEPRWVMKRLLGTIRELFVVVFLENNRLCKLRSIATGVFHAAEGRRGARL